MQILKQGKPALAFLYLFTQTPLHIGAGSSVGAIDLPIIRERHTGFPIIPGSAIKGVFRDEWVKKDTLEITDEGKKLFGVGSDSEAQSGLIQFTEAKLLAFPIRSLKGCFAWITSPLILKRYFRDLHKNDFSMPNSLIDNKALFKKDNPISIEDHSTTAKVILEEYIFEYLDDPPEILYSILTEELTHKNEILKEIPKRIVIVSDGTMSFFTQTACQIAQHVKIDDKTGTAEEGALFNQENVPSETLFYSVVRRSSIKNDSFDPFEKLTSKIKEKNHLFQFGADAGTGLGYCTTFLNYKLHIQQSENQF